MKNILSVILMREDVPYQNKTLRDILNAIIVGIWLAGFILFMFGIFSIYQLFV